MASKSSSWSDLPKGLLLLIFDCVKDPFDILRCGAACKSWLPTALQVYRKLLFPLCLMKCGLETDQNNPPVLFHLLAKKTRNIHLPEVESNWFCCSCNNWVLILDSIHSPEFPTLLHVFSRTQIDLPPLTSFPDLLPFLRINLFIINISRWKLLLSDSPLSSDCTIFLIGPSNSFERPCTLLSCKPGDKEWSQWNRHWNFSYWLIHDAILHKGKLYVTINDRNEENCLVICNYQFEIEAMVSVPDSLRTYLRIPFLVKSLDDHLWLVGQSIGPDMKSYEIFEFDDCTKEFKEVNDLADCALFLNSDGNHRLAKAGRFETWFKANDVYVVSPWTSFFRIYNFGTRKSEFVPCHFQTESGYQCVSLWVKPDA